MEEGLCLFLTRKVRKQIINRKRMKKNFKKKEMIKKKDGVLYL